MKKIFSFILSLTICVSVFAQDPSYKVVLKKGDIIKVTSNMNSSNTQSMMGGEPMESKTTVNSYTELEVKEVLENSYILGQTLKKMKMDFEGFGQKMTYDSESEEKQDNPFVKQISEKINVPEEMKMGFDGKEIEDASKEEKPKGNKKGGGKGMMRMMTGGSGGVLETAFLVIPKDAFEKKGWETSSEKDGLTTRKKYSIGAIMGNMATVTVQSQIKGDVNMNQGGMAMTSKVNTVSEDMVMVNITTGKVQMFTSQMTNNSKTIMNDTESPSTGKTSITATFE